MRQCFWRELRSTRTPSMFGMPQAVHDALAVNVPLPSRLGTPGDYAKLVRHIFENAMLNGEVIQALPTDQKKEPPEGGSLQAADAFGQNS